MAITPQEAGQLTEAALRQAETLEKEIDDYLRETFVAGMSNITFSFDKSILEIQQVLPGVTNAIVRRYQEAGWEVSLESDQKEGISYFRLKPKT